MTRRTYAVLIAFVAVTACASCESLPRDPNGSTQQIMARGTLRVGLIEHPPWVIRTDAEPAGAEVELIKGFAASLGATPEWQWGGEERLLGALEKYELDVVAGGLSEKTPWSDRVGLTKSYFRENFVVGVPPGQTPPDRIKNLQVGVGSDVRLAAIVREQKAIPVEIPTGNPASVPVAAPDWQLGAMALSATHHKLQTDDHVIAVAPGENQLVKRIEEYLGPRRNDIEELLRSASEVQQ